MNELIEQLEGIRGDLTSTRIKHSDRTESALVHITKAVELLKEEVATSEMNPKTPQSDFSDFC